MKEVSKKELHPVMLRLPKHMVARIDEMCAVDGQTRTAFIRSAVSRALKNWSSPLDNPALWNPCQHCGKRHDPKMAHGVEF